MSQFNRKGFSTVKAGDGHGGVKNFAVRQNGKLARLAKHKKKQMARARNERVRGYKQQLRDAKKKFPIEERSHLRIEDL